jgi:hypothetical protein
VLCFDPLRIRPLLSLRANVTVPTCESTAALKTGETHLFCLYRSNTFRFGDMGQAKTTLSPFNSD